MPNKKALVTGGAGFIGSHLVDELLKLNLDVVVIDDLSGGFVENVNRDVKFIQGDIGDVEFINDIFKEERFDYVFHLAAYAAEGLSHFIKHFNYQNNLIGSVNLINASINNDIKCFVFTSSIAVYGAGQLPMIESTKPQPEDSYGISKYAIELELEASHKMFGLNYIIFRPHNVYGERQNIGDKYRNVVGIFMNQIMQDKPLTIFGDGNQQRAFTYIGDVAPIIANSIFNESAYNDIFNIGANTFATVNKLVNVVSEAMGAEAKTNYLPARNEVVSAYSDHSKVQRILGYQDLTSLEDGVEKMASWAKEEGAKQSKKFENIEILKNLPPSWA